MENTMFSFFCVHDVEYYLSGGKYYADNGTIRETITLKAYRKAMVEYLIHS